MNTVIWTKNDFPPPVCEREVLRYAGCRQADPAVSALLTSCMKESLPLLTYSVCYRVLPVTITAEVCDFGAFTLRSQQLAKNLTGCTHVLLFAATVGVALDRLIAKYGRLRPSKALMLQALGAERIEALCDAFCSDMAAELNAGLRPRFSPGYGDLPLTAQKDIFAVLDCSRRIGLTLNDSLLMSPSKSVTAFAGLTSPGETIHHDKCRACNQKDCAFRGAL